MQLIMKTLLSSLMILSISGCAGKIVYLPQKCYISSIEEPIIDNSDSNTSLDASKKCVKNYMKQKEYAEKLKEQIKICQ